MAGVKLYIDDSAKFILGTLFWNGDAFGSFGCCFFWFRSVLKQLNTVSPNLVLGFGNSVHIICESHLSKRAARVVINQQLAIASCPLAAADGVIFVS